MKALTPAIDNMLRGKSLRLAVLAELDLPDGRIERMWSGLGTLSYNGFSWAGLGKMGRITWAGETAEIRTVETSYELTGILDATAIDEFLARAIRNGTAKCWLAFLDDAEQVIPTPLLIDQTILDAATVHYGANGASTLALRGTSAIFNFRQPKGRYLTNEQLQADYPGDTGFDRIAGLANRVVSWTKT